MGLKKYGKGDWRNISRNYVITRTPTQVASHAQKYFIRQLSGGKDKRRASIHDITTVNLNEHHQSPSPESKKTPSPEQPSVLAPPNMEQKLPYQWSHTSNEAVMGFTSLCHGNNMFTSSSPYGLNSYGIKLQRGLVNHDSFMGSQNTVFQMQTELHYPNAWFWDAIVLIKEA